MSSRSVGEMSLNYISCIVLLMVKFKCSPS
uniref:Uncharacterized protein n=1 Tax=Anguilla anguilla TaxID=7936 RepID=A0A0E9QEC8_ANGAN